MKAPMGIKITRRHFLLCSGAAGAVTVAGVLGCAMFPTANPGTYWKPLASDRVALVNVRIVDVKKGELHKESVLVYQSGRIEKIVNPEDPILHQAKKIDCGGGWLIPGLINAHAHLTLPSIKQADISAFDGIRGQIYRNYKDSIAWGITTVRDMAALPRFIKKDREMIDSGKLIGPHILTPISFLTVKGGYPEFFGELPGVTKAVVGSPSVEADTPDKAADLVKMLHDEGADFVKIAFDHLSNLWGRDRINTLSDAQMEALTRQAARLSMPVAAHHFYSLGLDRGIQFGIDSMEHLVTDRELTEEQVKKIVDNKIPHIPTVTPGLNLAYLSKGDPYSEDPFLLQKLKWREQNLDQDWPKHCNNVIQKYGRELHLYNLQEKYALPENQNRRSTNPRLFTRAVVIGAKNIKKLIDAGAVIGVGNDAGVPLTFPGQLRFEMMLLQLSGMDAAQVLRAATMVNARICRVDKECGSIEPGKRADLVLLGANPLDDLENLSKVTAVFKEGQLVARSDSFSV